MSSLKNKKILLGVTGSIAAYKTPELVRLLVKSGANVQVITTPAALDFVTTGSLATVSKNPVLTHFFKNETGQWNNHVDLGLWADAFIIAPCSANTIGKMAHGLCDNLLMATYLSARCPVFTAPAMDLDMLQHPAVQSNIESLKQFGVHIIEPTTGELASGLIGKGRMAEPADIHLHLEQWFGSKKKLLNKKVLISAGPTFENIDPVRFIGNHSSGKMGFALAAAFAEAGADVTLVSGPVNIPFPQNVRTVEVRTALEMEKQCNHYFLDSDIAIMAAAVADYRPASPAEQKIKKNSDSMTIELVKNPDILAGLGKIKRKNQVLVGFALETENAIEYAKEKLTKKNLDMIVMNTLQDKNAGFGFDTNKVTFIYPEKKVQELPLLSKDLVALHILDAIAEINDVNLKNS